ncbi:endonuclease domain-containing protein [Glaciibacter sp. 2TAF33]|uniref:endonuclease domain-containing protein n=1 Tax=Glaciibacter sp. 2TAF33 TaxID=3233015 RepID=UPI003F8E627F
MPSDQFFSHVTAALLHGLPLPRRFLERRSLDVATAVRGRRRSGVGVHGHLVPHVGMVEANTDGLGVASVVDVWCQLATSLSLDELIVVGDSLVRRQRPLATLVQLEQAVASHSGRPGVRRLREALALVRVRTDSPRETRLRLIIVRAGLPEPEVNAEIVDRYGVFLAWGDLVYPHQRVLVEYDGEQHRDDEEQFHRDVDRVDALMEEGWRVIRFNKSHLGPRQPEIIGRIRRALLERGWNPAA